MPNYLASRIADITLQAALETQASRLGTDSAEEPLIAQLRTIVPFEQFMISGIDYDGLRIGNGVFLASDMPLDAIRTYIERRLVEKDPLAKRLSSSQPVASWHDLSDDDLASDDAIEIAGFCKYFGLAARTSIALQTNQRIFGAATFTRTYPFSEAELFILTAVARQAHDVLSRQRLALMNSHLGLSAGELAGLRAITEGASVEEAAQQLGYSPDTVQTYLKSSMKKLQAKNRAHAVAEAFRRRLVF